MAQATRPQRGFTFIELMMTLALLGVLATVAMPLAQLMHQRRQEQALAEALREIRQAIDAYRRAADQGRIAIKAGDSGFPPSLEALVEGVPDQRSAARQNLYFLRRLPRDPLAADPTVAPAETWARRSSESPPDAPREGRDVFDVMSRATGTGLNGIPYREW
ncbi:General secretion pathway protein GspG [Rubrivivax sp. A210]|nr:General secretion pathway protein GspG [Rubrivivax sp. A210]